MIEFAEWFVVGLAVGLPLRWLWRAATARRPRHSRSDWI